jgi:hypothetical protein
MSMVIGVSRSRVFVKQLDLFPKQKLEYTLWRRVFKKMAPVWPDFDLQKQAPVAIVILLTMPS